MILAFFMLCSARSRLVAAAKVRLPAVFVDKYDHSLFFMFS